MDKKTIQFFSLFLLFVFCIGCIGVLNGQVYAAEPASEYLQYQEPKSANSISWFSTISYVFSLIITFAVVIGLAYFASRFLGKKLGSLSASGSSRIVNTLSLGTNRTVYTVEIAGKILILGVTDHNITVLQEITDVEEIEKIRKEQVAVPVNQFEGVFQKQLASLEKISQMFPAAFGATQNEHKDERGKR